MQRLLGSPSAWWNLKVKPKKLLTKNQAVICTKYECLMLFNSKFLKSFLKELVEAKKLRSVIDRTYTRNHSSCGFLVPIMDGVARHNSNVIVIYLHGWSVCKKCRSYFLSIAYYYNVGSAFSMGAKICILIDYGYIPWNKLSKLIGMLIKATKKEM